jgi:hypothetical protein
VETVVRVPDSFTCPVPLTLAACTGDTVDGSPLARPDPVEATGDDPAIIVSPVSGKSFSVSCK